MRRRQRLSLIAAAAIFFLLVSAVLARIYSSVAAERAAVTALVQDEARGDPAAMLDDLYDCRSSQACRARVAEDATNLRRPGPVTVLQLTVSTSFPLGGDVGVARIAWQPGHGLLPVTQCVRVRHAGNPITGLEVQLLEVSERIKTNGDCPSTF